MTSQESLPDVELDLLLEGILRTYHYDFRDYVRSSLRRRLERALSVLGFPTVTSLLDRVLRDPRVFNELLAHLTIQVSDFFRDPSYWRALRERVIPHLATYPFVRVWVAGCGAGEEAYSMAILLAEEGLLDRTQIYATDISLSSLEAARSGIYELDRLRSFSENYFGSGGRSSLADYYTTAYSQASFDAALRKRILFSDHSLATDAAFAEVQLVSCRNVLIYFDRPLQDRAFGVFVDALCPRGFLGLGAQETPLFSAHGAALEPFAAQEKIYRRRVAAC